nr:MAG: hypothetical protein [Bacteriophage sp.]
MKELKEIIDGIAHSLNMTVDGLVKVYPQIRTEYSWYYVCNTFQVIFALLFLLSIGISAVTLAIWAYSVNNYRSTEKCCNDNLKAFKVSSAITLVMFVIVLLIIALKSFMCPDVLIINRLISATN